MDLEFSVMYKSEKVTDVKIKDNIVSVVRYSMEPFKQPFLGNNIDIGSVNRFFNSRCIPRERADLEELLIGIGLDSYDVIEILKKTHGLDYADFTWINFSDNPVLYDDIKIR